MREARSLILVERRLRDGLIASFLALAGWGCHQPPCYYYYGCGIPPCAPVSPAPIGVQSSAVSDVPTQVIEGGTTATEGSRRATVVQGTQRYPRVVVSEPADPPRFSWRRSNHEGTLATTSVEGAVTDSSVNR